MQKYGHRFSFFPLLLVFLLAVSLSAAAQETSSSTPLSQPTTISEPKTMLSWSDLEALSAELSSKASDLVPQVMDLNSQLGQLQSSLSACAILLQQSLDMRKSEAEAAGKSIKAALNRSYWWMRGTFVLGGGFVGYLVDGWEGAAYGAGAGAAIDAVLEISARIRIKL